MPAPIYTHPTGALITEAQSTLADLSPWSVVNNGGATITFNDGKIAVSNPSATAIIRVALTDTVPNGASVRWWLKFRTLTETNDARVFIRFAAGNQISTTMRYTGWLTGHGTASADRGYLEVCVAQGPCEISHVAVAMAAPIADEELDIILLAGQSNMVGASSGSLPDPDIDLPHPDLLAMWQVTNAGYNVTADEIDWARAPLQHRTVNTYMGPGLAFGRYYVENILTPGRKALLICSGKGSTSLTSANGAWNPDGSSPTEYDAMIAAATAALGYSESNRVVAMVWSQGETDIGAYASYASAFENLLGSVRTDLADDTIPAVIMGLNPNVVGSALPNTLNMIAAQEGLADDEAGIVYSGWDDAWGDGTKETPLNDADTVHFSTSANRLRGEAAAVRFGEYLGDGRPMATSNTLTGIIPVLYEAMNVVSPASWN